MHPHHLTFLPTF